MKREEEVKKEEEEEGCPSPSPAGGIAPGGGTRGEENPGVGAAAGKGAGFSLSIRAKKARHLKEVKRAPKKEQRLTCFAFPVAARCLPRQLTLPGPRGAGGGGERHWGSSRRSLKAQAERQELFSLKSWFVDFTELWD